MSAITSICNFIDDRFNPIVVKEVRQSVQSRFILAVITFFLLLQTAVLAFALINESVDISTSMTAGRDVFTGLHVVVLITCFFVIPLVTLVRLSAERSDTNVDLVFVSAIRPGSIVWGKFWSAMMLAGLIYSASLPYLTITFLLRGIDGPSVLVVAAMDFLLIAAAVMSAILVGCLPLTIAIKRLISLLYFAFMVFCLISLIGISSVMIHQGIGSKLGTNDFWTGAGFFTLLVVMGCILASGIAVAGITPASANRALWIRISFTIAWVVMGVTAIIWHYWMLRKGHHWGGPNPMLLWAICSTGVLCVFYIATASERDEYGDRVLRTVPRNFLLRAIYFLFSSGSASGFLWTTTLLLITIAIAFVGHPPTSIYKWQWQTGMQSLANFNTMLRTAFHDSEPLAMLCVAAYVFCYAMTATLFRWWFLRKKLKTAVNSALALATAATATVGPVIVAFMIESRETRRGITQNEIIFVGNPFYAMNSDPNMAPGYSMYRLYIAMMLLAWITLLLLAGLPWFYSQFKQFKRPVVLAKPFSENDETIPDPIAQADIVQTPGEAI